MAKVKAPLLSFGASGAIAKTQVYFPWKGLNVVRKHVVPANPKTAAQTLQRGHVTTAVALVHAAMATATHKLSATDKSAYSLLAAAQGIVMTWFNTIVRLMIKNYIASKKAVIFRDGVITPTSGQLVLVLYWTKDGSNDVTAGYCYYGTSKSALLSNVAAVIDATTVTCTMTALTNGVKYYFQFRPTAHSDFANCNSGIYYGVPHA